MQNTDVDLSGKVALVTGATSGIGEVSAMALARMGAHVHLLCRNSEKGRSTVERIQAETGNQKIELIIADMADLSQVRRAAEDFLASGSPLHILLNNAGITNTRYRETVDGIEETFAVNHLAPFLLTQLLTPRLKESAPARIVMVASRAHHLVNGIQFDDIGYRQNYKTFQVYGQSKLANMLYALELKSRLQGTGVTVNSVHPGAVATGLGAQNGLLGKIIPILTKPFFRSPEKGAESSIYACTSPELDGISGLYLFDCKELTPKPWAKDVAAAKRLWKVSEEMVGLSGAD